MKLELEVKMNRLRLEVTIEGLHVSELMKDFAATCADHPEDCVSLEEYVSRLLAEHLEPEPEEREGMPPTYTGEKRTLQFPLKAKLTGL